MITTALKIMLVGLAFLGLSCIATLMFSFMGGSAGSPDASAVLSLQRAGIVFCVLAIIAALFYWYRQSDTKGVIRSLWRHLPGWLVFAGGLSISLTLMGEVAWVVVRFSAPGLVDAFNHVSLICLGAASLAFLVLYATLHLMRGHPEYSKDRW